MRQFSTLKEIADALESDRALRCVEDLVEELVNGIGRLDKVMARHDDHLGLLLDLPRGFLSMSIDQADGSSSFDDQRDDVLKQGNIIFELVDRGLSEDDLAEIREDHQSLGIRDDD